MSGHDWPDHGLKVVPGGTTTTVHDAEFGASACTPAAKEQPGDKDGITQVTSTALSYSDAVSNGRASGGAETPAPAPTAGQAPPGVDTEVHQQGIERVESEEDIDRARSHAPRHPTDPVADRTSEETTHGATDPPREMDPASPRTAPISVAGVPNVVEPNTEAHSVPSDGPSGHAPTRRSGEGARSEASHRILPRQRERRRPVSAKAYLSARPLDHVPGKHDVGIEIEGLPEQQPPSGDTEELAAVNIISTWTRRL